MLAQRRRREDQVVAELGADRLGLLVEEHHRDLRAHAALEPAAHVGAHLGVLQQPVVDVLAAVELDVGLVLRA